MTATTARAAATHTVLVVEDNEITRKFLRVTLAGAGYRVVACADGASALAEVNRQRPDLVVLDIGLPDMTGFELVEALRRLPGCAELPMVAASGYLDSAEVARLASAAFDDLLVKPIEPARLLRVVGAWLPEAGHVAVERSSRLLLVDDDPLQLKLGRALLKEAGFTVDTARDGAEALEQAQAQRPDIVLSDVLMPRMDGFELCQTLRSRSDLGDVPVVLLTSNYLEEADRKLAREVGANALVVRTPDLAEAIRTVVASIGAPAPKPVPGEATPLMQEHYRRVLRQMERQVQLNAELSRRTALQGAMLELVGSLSEALARARDVETAFRESLGTILDASGVSRGALYICDGDRSLHLTASVGFAAEARQGPADFFGHRGLLESLLGTGTHQALTATSAPEARDLLRAAQLGSALVVPLLAGGDCIGMLFLGSTRPDMDSEWQAFARAMAVQVGQALQLQHAMAETRASEARYKALVENVPGAVWTKTFDGRTTFVSAGIEAMTGIPAQELIGGGLQVWLDAVDPDDLPRLFAAKDALVDEGAPLDLEYRLRRRDGTWVWLHHTAVRSRTEGGGEIEAVLTDVSERRRLEAQLMQAQKMEAVGQLTAGIAHDFNNLLAVILANGSWLADELAADDPRREGAVELLQAAEKAAGVTRQLLAFSRRQVLERRTIDLGDLVSGMEQMLRRALGEAIELRTRLDAVPATVRVDPGQLEQVVLNLVVNARDAMPRGGRLEILTWNQMSDPARHPELPPGPCVVLAVRDTGSGMSAETLGHIFEPFFTTKERGKGTGLGLSTCWGIVRQSGGYILARSEPDHGSTFEVWLPQVAAAPQDAVLPARITAGGTETILLLEDDDAVRGVVARALTTYGYRVLVASNGAEALAVAADLGAPLDLVVSDLIMPGEDGLQLVDRLRERQPDLKVLFMSGYADHPGMRDRLAAAEHVVLAKPFLPADLARRVREVLDAG